MVQGLDEHEPDSRTMCSNGDFQEQVFYVGLPKEDFDPLIPPATGQEYIQRVALEASKCEDVLVATVDRSRIKKPTVKLDINVAVSEPPLFTPSTEWQQCQVADFSAIRQNLARHKSLGAFTSSIPLPAKCNEAGWRLLCFGNDTEPVEGEEAPSIGVPPLLTILLSMNQALVEQVLEYHVQWLETKSYFTDQQGRWLYSLLACLELPLLPETCSLLRTLARECLRLRASLKSVDDPSMASLSLIICLVANYFRQMDLADT